MMRLVIAFSFLAVALSACASRESNYWAGISGGVKQVIEQDRK